MGFSDQFNKEFSNAINDYKNAETTNHVTHVPKCPTCGSTNVKKIGAGKRWVSTGMFGLASSNLGKTMQCGSCGAKW